MKTRLARCIRRRTWLPAVWLAALSLALGAAVWAAAQAASGDDSAALPEIPGLGDPGKLNEVRIEQPFSLLLRGRDARQQLVVTGVYSSGQHRDLTTQVAYSVAPAGVVKVDSSGFVTPTGNGRATITARGPGGLTGTCQVEVQQFDELIPINFVDQIVPIFTKLGCNSGGCHGKSSGQNGFKLSLLGFYPDEDYEYLVKEARGRRLFPAAPERSLLLQKATNSMAHGGGQRMDASDFEYTLLRNWIAQGMPYGSPDDPRVVRLTVFPEQRALDRGAQQQIAVYAHYSDGSVQDVTRMAQFEDNDPEMTETSRTGLVRILDTTGEAAVMVRFQEFVTVFRASIPMGVKATNVPPARNYIDELVFGKLQALGIPPSPVCDDATFLRRAYLDITGTLPTAVEVRAFLAYGDPTKRDKLVDRLVDSPEYADFFANKWAAILRNRNINANYTTGTYAFHAWIRDSLNRDLPYDEFVRTIIAASGDITGNPPVAWYRALNTPEALVEDTAQLFLGLRIQCARCHHHPFEQWSQRDYYGFAAFFTQVGRKTAPGAVGNQALQENPRIYHRRGLATAVNPRTAERLSPTGLGSEPLQLTPDDDPRHALVDWMAAPDNRFFAPSLVNRYWKHFFGRGIVDPEDDMRVTNPPSNPELLDALAQDFIRSGFRLKHLVRTICKSHAYQLSSEPNDYNVIDKQNYSRYYPKRLHAEVLYDALSHVTGTPTAFGGLPAGTRAVQLPDQGINNYFLTVFGKPQGNSPCECERSAEANLAQTLHLLMSREVQDKLTNARSRAALLAADTSLTDQQRIEELYLWAYARLPQPDELQFCLQYLPKAGSSREAYEDLLWALINTKEFLFVR